MTRPPLLSTLPPEVRATLKKSSRATNPLRSESARAAVFKAMLRQASLPSPHTEHRFADGRKWRFDYAWPQHRVAVEQEGGVWTRGRHTRGTGFLRDMEKYNAAALLGWRVLRVTPTTLCTEATLDMLRRALTPTEEPR